MLRLDSAGEEKHAGWGAQILVIAVLMKGILKRSFSVFQWEALVLLVAGITVNQLNYCGKDAGGGCLCPPRTETKNVCSIADDHRQMPLRHARPMQCCCLERTFHTLPGRAFKVALANSRAHGRQGTESA